MLRAGDSQFSDSSGSCLVAAIIKKKINKYHEVLKQMVVHVSLSQKKVGAQDCKFAGIIDTNQLRFECV